MTARFHITPGEYQAGEFAYEPCETCGYRGECDCDGEEEDTAPVQISDEARAAYAKWCEEMDLRKAVERDLRFQLGKDAA